MASITVLGTIYTQTDQDAYLSYGYGWVCFQNGWYDTVLASRPQDVAYEEGVLGSVCYDMGQLQQMLDQGVNGPPAPPATGGGGGTTTPPTTTPPSGGGVTLPPAYKILPDILKLDMAIIPTGEPASTVVLSVVVSLISLFGIGGSSKVGTAVEGVRNGLVRVSDALIRFGIAISHHALDILTGLKKVWDKGVKPIMRKLEEVIDRAKRVMDKVLKPYLEWMQRIRQQILYYYEHVIRPMIEVIQRVRRMVAILKLLRVPFAKKLDEKLVRLEGKLIAPITALLRRVNDHSGILNVLLRTELILQRPTFLNTMHTYQGQWIRMWWNGQQSNLTPAAEAAIAAQRAELNSGREQRALDTLLETGLYVPTRSRGPKQLALDELLRRRNP